MCKFFLQLLVLLVTGVFITALAVAQEAKTSGGMVILRGDQLTQSVTTFDKGEFGPIKVVAKLWEDGFGDLDRSRRFHIFFDTYTEIYDGAENVKHTFLQPIMVLDRERPVGGEEEVLFQDQIPIYDWDSADCSLQKMMLITKNGTTYLAVAYRSHKDHTAEMTPQSERAPQNIKLYKLIYNPPTNLNDRFFGYFMKISEHKTKASACSAEEVYQQIKTFADSTLK